MKMLGKACGIRVGAATVAINKVKTVFAELYLQKLCFCLKYEPPGCVGLVMKSEGRKNIMPTINQLVRKGS